MIKIWNNGKGIPVVRHKDEKLFVPTLIFGTLLTSSNYDDSQKKVTGKTRVVIDVCFCSSNISTTIMLFQVGAMVTERNCATSSAPSLWLKRPARSLSAASNSRGRII